jgi:hypothetical protein
MSALAEEVVREVTRDGARVALLRSYPQHGSTLVETEITAAGAELPVHRGPHVFASRAEAHRFVEEALLALRYLGCGVER